MRVHTLLACERVPVCMQLCTLGLCIQGLNQFPIRNTQKKKKKNSRTFQRAKLEFVKLATIYIVFTWY